VLGKEKQENWRASLVPAAAVIPTPRVCVRDAAVKRSVVGLWKEGYPDGCVVEEPMGSTVYHGER
jgi:hypothetical protein